jgi:hypothetical protein
MSIASAHTYASLERYNRLRNAWVKKFGTDRNFNRWYGLNEEIELLKAQK